MTRFKSILLIALMAISLMGVAGCDPNSSEGPAEQAGKAIDEAVEKADETLKEVAEDTKDAVNDVAEDVKKEVQDAVDE